MNLLDKFFITEIKLVSQIRPQIKDLTLNTPDRKIRKFPTYMEWFYQYYLFQPMHRMCYWKSGYMRPIG